MKVLIPSVLRSYTDDRAWVTASGGTLAEVLADLDRQFPGIRFRMVDEQDALRPHVRFFANGEALRRLDEGVAELPELLIVQALSGG